MSDPQTADFTRHFVTVGERQVHYRRAGNGPPVVLLHSSPLSSRAMTALGAHLAESFTVLALDTPGYGLSDPLPAPEPTITDYADVLAATVAALGLERTFLYGIRTGALIGLDFCYRHPDRIAGAVLEAVPMFSEDRRREFAERYAPVFEPEWNGTHLTATWARFRDRFMFFPWYDRRDANRVEGGIPEATALHAGFLDQLRAGAHYAIGYQAAFAYDPAPAVAGLEAPATFVVRPGDQLEPDLASIEEIATVPTEHLPADRSDGYARILALLGDGSAVAPAPAPPPVEPMPGRILRTFAQTSQGRLHVRMSGTKGGRPLVMLHASPTSAKSLEPLIETLGGERLTIAFDTLGNGDSDKPAFSEASSADYAALVAEALADLDIEEFDLYGSHTGATIAMEVAIADPDGTRHLILDGIPMFDEEETRDRIANHAPPLEIRGDGAHLAWAWMQATQRSLYHHWYRPTQQEIKHVEPPTPDQMHEWLMEFLKSGETYHIAYLAAFRYPTAERLPLVTVPTLVCAVASDVLAPYSEEAAAVLADGQAAVLPADTAGAAKVLGDFLDG